MEVKGRLTVSSKDAAMAGFVQIRGFPQAAVSPGAENVVSVVGIGYMEDVANSANYAGYTGYFVDGNTYFWLLESPLNAAGTSADTSAFPVSQLGANPSFLFSFSYPVK